MEESCVASVFFARLVAVSGKVALAKAVDTAAASAQDPAAKVALDILIAQVRLRVSRGVAG